MSIQINEFKMDSLHPGEFGGVIECSDFTASSPWHFSDLEKNLLSVTGYCLEPPAIQLEEGEEEWSSDSNSLLV